MTRSSVRERSASSLTRRTRSLAARAAANNIVRRDGRRVGDRGGSPRLQGKLNECRCGCRFSGRLHDDFTADLGCRVRDVAELKRGVPCRARWAPRDLAFARTSRLLGYVSGYPSPRSSKRLDARRRRRMVKVVAGTTRGGFSNRCGGSRGRHRNVEKGSQRSARARDRCLTLARHPAHEPSAKGS